MLKKVAIVLLVLLSGLVAAKVFNLPIPFLNSQTDSQDTMAKSKMSKDASILNFVPADSVMYFSSDIKLMHAAMEFANMNAIFEQAKNEMGSMSDSEAKIMSTVFNTFEAFFTAKGAEEFGFATQGELGFYMNGMFPVLKVAVADKMKVQAKLDALFTQFDSALVKSDVAGQTIQTLNIEDKLLLSLSIDDQYLSLTVSAAEVEPSFIASILSNTHLADSLIASGVIAADQSKYGFNDSFAMAINFEKIAEAIVNPQTNTLGQQLVQFVPESQQTFAMVQSQECQADIMGIASAMPRLVTGYSKLDIKQDSIAAKTTIVLEILNPEVTNILKMFVGHISSNTFSADSLLSVGVGVDVANLGAALDQLTQLVQTTEFNCAPLVMGKMMVPEVPAQIAFATAMAGSVKGVSASIIDVDVDFSQQMPALKTLDALINVSTNDPESLALMAMGNGFVTFDPLNVDGTPSKLESMFLPPEIELYAAIKNNFLTVYSGEKGATAADSLSTESLDANSLLSVALNLGKILAKEELITNAMAMSGEQLCSDPTFSDSINLMTSNRGSESVQLTFNDFGLVFSAESESIKAETPLNLCP